MKISQDSAKSELERLCDRNVDTSRSDFIYLKGLGHAVLGNFV